MRQYTDLDRGWEFHGPNGTVETVDVPHTWNNVDGQDGGNDYWRGTCEYRRSFDTPRLTGGEQAYLVFDGVNATADVAVNGCDVCHHDGGYSTFRVNVTDVLAPEGEANELVVRADNSVNDRIYPQKADFTFYGGIYRDVSLLVVSAAHFSLEYHGGPGLAVTPAYQGDTSKVRVQTWLEGEGAEGCSVRVTATDASGAVVATGEGTDCVLTVESPHLWDGLDDPYLYRATAQLVDGGTVVDEVTTRFGIRTYSYDPKKGFFLNGRSYPLRGVCRHQDRKGLGNAITKREHLEDMELIKEIGANTLRLAHYQQAQFFYDLCDEAGIIVWAEIPYISEHMPNGRENTISMMTELITQSYNHPSIVCWGVCNEITISTKHRDKKDLHDNIRVLNDLCHKLDPTRFTTLACYAVCGPFNKTAFITDVVSWNLYLGWYIPGLFLNDLWFGFFHLVHPNRTVGMSEYGAEAMPNLHSSKPRIGDHSEEYQCVYHEYMAKFFAKRPWVWATHVWNMFDFAADARDQGGEPGMNHKGLVTFDRKIKKDAFYLYKAWWSKEPFVHLCGSRYVDRPESVTTIKVYTNQSQVKLYANGKLVESKSEDPSNPHVFNFRVPLAGEVELRAEAGDCVDESRVRHVDTPNPSYRLQKKSSQKSNWADN